MACSSFIEGWSDPVRLHSALGCRLPVRCEEEVHTEPQPTKP